MEVINLEVLITVITASFVVAKIFNAIKDRMGYRWENLSDVAKEFSGYGMVVVSALLMWLTGLDMLPGFDAVLPWVGRVLTCVIAGFGPGVVYDVWMDKPDTPTA